MNIKRIGIDLAKQIFQLHGVDGEEKTMLVKRLSRHQLLKHIANMPPCLIGMEACSGSHYWAREMQQLGHSVKLIAPQFVKPYVKTNKNDARDAEAICEALSRPSMRFVPIKTVYQQDVQAIHRIRQDLVEHRTAKANQIRGLLAEYGVVIGQRLDVLRRALPLLVEDSETRLTSRFKKLLLGLSEDLKTLDMRIDELDKELAREVKNNEAMRLLLTIPGIGPVTATAIVSAVGDGSQFKCGREMAAWIGLTPKQNSSGGKERLSGISKRGNAYLRSLLIQGAQSLLKWADTKDDPRSCWLVNLRNKRNPGVAAVAMANKNARIVWAVLTQKTEYRPKQAHAALAC